MAMNNNITEDYCSFEVSKLLKEKGFNISCNSRYNNEGRMIPNMSNKNFRPELQFLGEAIPHYSRPTHSLAIKWIRENVSFIDIWIEPHFSKEPKLYTAVIWNRGGWTRFPPKGSFEEATEAALLYVLKNLI